MSILKLIEEARAHGVELYLEGDALRFRAHGQKLSTELKSKLQDQKAGLIAFLRDRQISLPDRQVELDDQTAPLTAAQQRMYFLHQAEGHNGRYNMAFSFELDGEIDAARIETAIRAIMQRHIVLRTTYDRRGEEVVQVPRPASRFVLSRVETTNHPFADEHVKRVSTEPFDLAADLPLRAALIGYGPGRAVLSLVFHHIAFDGWSYRLFLDELTSELAQRHIEPPKFQMADLARWSRNAANAGARMDYWHRRLAKVAMLNALPSDRPRRVNDGYKADYLSTRIADRTAACLDRLARSEGVTLFSVLQAILAAIVGRWTGGDHAVIGTPVSGRGHPTFDDMIGLFVNTLPIKTDIDPNQSFITYLRQADAALKADLANQETPFDQIVATVSRVRDPAFPPLLQILFAVGETDEDTLTIPDCRAVARTVERHDVNFELEVHAQKRDGGIDVSWHFAEDLFDRETIAEFAESFGVFLEAALAEPDKQVGRLPVVSDDKATRIAGWNRAADQALPYESFATRFAAQVSAQPGATACIDASRRWTYDELDAASSAMAARIVAAGVCPGDFVGLSVQRGYAMVLGIVAILKTGAAYVPLDGRLPKARINQVMEDCAPRLVVGDETTPRSLRDDRFMDLTDTDDAEIPFDARDISADLPAYVIFTSGTTGRPKGVVVTNGNLSSFLSGTRQVTPLHRGSVIPLITAISFDVHVVEVQNALVNGATVALPGEGAVTNPATLAALLTEFCVTDIHATPATWRMLIDAGGTAEPGARLYSGGDALPDDLKDTLLTLAPNVRLWNYYGPTEATVYVSATEMHLQNPVTVGQAMTGNGFHVLNASLLPLPAGVVGRLYLSGANLAHEYLGLPELTATRFPTDPASGQRLYDTGDLARWTRDGAITLLGRSDFQVKLRGHRVELGEIETLLSALPNVAEAVAVAAADGETLNAFVRPAPTPDQATAMRDHLATHLPAYMVPARITGVVTMPRTTSNKIDRAALSQMTQPLAPVHTAAVSDNERLIEGIWAALLDLDQVDVFANFFALGGHSLLTIRMLARLEARTHVAIPLRSFLMAPTISGLAQLLRSAQRATNNNDGAEVLL